MPYENRRPGSRAIPLAFIHDEVDPQSPSPSPGTQPRPDADKSAPSLSNDLSMPPSPAEIRGRKQSLWKSVSIPVPPWTGPRWGLRESKWKSPVRLVGFFIIGLICSLAHIIRYATRQGKTVEGSSEQERNIQYVILQINSSRAAEMCKLVF